MGLGDGALVEFEDLFAVFLFCVLFDGVLLEALDLVNAETDVIPLQIELPNQQAIRPFHQHIIPPHLPPLHPLIILPQPHPQIKRIINLRNLLTKRIRL